MKESKKGVDLTVVLGGPKMKGPMPKMKDEMPMEDEMEDEVDPELEGVMEELISDASSMLFDGDEEKGAALIDILNRLKDL